MAEGFLGSVADCPTALPCPLARFMVEPAAFRLGGATGPTGAPNTSPFGGNGGRWTALWALLAAGVAAAAEPMAFLACLHRFGWRWYMSSQARQKVWLAHSRHRTMASEMPHRSHMLVGSAALAGSELTGRPEATVFGRITGGGAGGAGGGPISS